MPAHSAMVSRAHDHYRLHHDAMPTCRVVLGGTSLICLSVLEHGGMAFGAWSHLQPVTVETCMHPGWRRARVAGHAAMCTVTNHYVGAAAWSQRSRPYQADMKGHVWMGQSLAVHALATTGGFNVVTTETGINTVKQQAAGDIGG